MKPSVAARRENGTNRLWRFVPPSDERKAWRKPSVAAAPLCGPVV
jgi:hypothetical protein